MKWIPLTWTIIYHCSLIILRFIHLCFKVIANSESERRYLTCTFSKMRIWCLFRLKMSIFNQIFDEEWSFGRHDSWTIAKLIALWWEKLYYQRYRQEECFHSLFWLRQTLKWLWLPRIYTKVGNLLASSRSSSISGMFSYWPKVIQSFLFSLCLSLSCPEHNRIQRWVCLLRAVHFSQSILDWTPADEQEWRIDFSGRRKHLSSSSLA